MNPNIGAEKSNLPSDRYIVSFFFNESVSHTSTRLNYLIEINNEGNLVSSKQVDYGATTMSSVLAQSNINLAYINKNEKIEPFYNALATIWMPDINITYTECYTRLDYMILNYVILKKQNAAIKIAKDLFFIAIRRVSDLLLKNVSNQYRSNGGLQPLVSEEFQNINAFEISDEISDLSEFYSINTDTAEFSMDLTQEVPIPALPEMSCDAINSQQTETIEEYFSSPVNTELETSFLEETPELQFFSFDTDYKTADDLVEEFLDEESIHQSQAIALDNTELETSFLDEIPELQNFSFDTDSKKANDLVSQFIRFEPHMRPIGPPPSLRAYVRDQHTTER